MTKKEKKQLSTGDIVGVVTGTILKSFVKNSLLRNEAHFLLERCAKVDEKAWDAIFTKFKLSNEFIYAIDHTTGTITVIRRK